MDECTPLEQSWLAEGFRRCPMSGLFVPAMMPVLCRPDGGHLVFRVEARPAHCNGHGTVHGGFLATLADIWLAYNVIHLLPGTMSIVTASLTVDYLAPTRAGDTLESQMDRIRLGGRLCHAAGAILSGGKPAAAMRGSFAVIEGRAAGD
jgi:acyl-coenzyme A thioesterase 13